MRQAEKEEADKSLWESFLVDPAEAFQLIMDPCKKERDDEDQMKIDIKASKKAWRKIRSRNFSFLDNNNELSESASQVV